MGLNKLLTVLYYIGMLLLFVGIVMHLVGYNAAFAVYVAGLIPILGVRIFNLVIGRPENQRKHVILVLSGLALAGAGAAIYFDRTYWVVLIAVAAVLDFYISFRRF